ncbi:hypothetical protein H6CHR_03254 [Variovorax sp. PBL-H6]|uniref:hypothetical protein n=1 Tax=Variovorax sp. PBL-H6 TaxID=434009 RepID=UPI001316CDC3|nr:hypothetical protein [Variovorax sp. PBL-H6]VTU29739.1 hypothetical protein H6CHR_03254 [Variovorax sp. PBL-H6]
METLKTATKTAAAEQLRAFAVSPETDFALAAIFALGELGGSNALNHIEELMDEASDARGPNEKAKWAALLRAYGRASRLLPE